MSKPLKGFITYSHEDTEAKKELRKRLAVMEQNNELVAWDDGQLTPGDGALQEDILKKIVDSDLLLYLVSVGSLASKNCNTELAEALKQGIRVIPIILEHCDWLNHQLSGFEVLPHKGKPVSKWEDESEGWQNVVNGIRTAVDEMQTQAKSSSESVQNRRLAEWVFQQGNFLLMLKQTKRAIEAYSHVIELNPCDASAYINRGVAYDQKGKFDKAMKDYKTSIALNPHFAEAYNNRGVAYRNKNKYDCAIKEYTKAIELNPDYAVAYNNRGNTYDGKGEINKAINDYNIAIELNPDYAVAYNNRGNAYDRKGEINKAIDDYNMAIQLERNLAEAYNNRGKAYRSKNDLTKALKDYNTAIQLKDDFAEAYNNRARIYRDKGKIDKAFDDYNTAIALNPDFTEAYNNRGVTYGIIGQIDKAIDDFIRAINLKRSYAEAYYNSGNAYLLKGDFNQAIKNYDMSIKLDPDDAPSYCSRGNVYYQKGELDLAIKDYTTATELDPQLAPVYYNRGEVWLHLQEWEKAKTDLTTAKRIGVDIIAAFHNSYRNVETFEQRKGFRLPEDLALLLTQRRRDRFPKKRRVLHADGNPIESPNVVNLRQQLRNVGMPLGDYVKTKPAFGINTAPTEAFVVDRATRDKLITAYPLSADILKPFLHGQDLRRWHVDTPQQWLIFAHRGIAINDYPAILKHLEKYREPLSKRKGKQEWYELPVSLGDAERFTQPKLVSPNTYNHQTFAVDTSGYYYGNTSYLILTEETWLCGLLNSRTVEWFYSQVSNQLTIDPLRARSGYIQQIPIPDLTSTQKALIANIVDYLIYLQQQPTTNSKDLKHARDAIMLGYFERIIDGLVYEAYLPEDLHKGDKHFFQPLLDEQLPSCEEIQGDKMTVLRDIFELLYERTHLVRRNLYYLDSVKAVRIIEGKI